MLLHSLGSTSPLGRIVYGLMHIIVKVFSRTGHKIRSQASHINSSRPLPSSVVGRFVKIRTKTTSRKEDLYSSMLRYTNNVAKPSLICTIFFLLCSSINIFEACSLTRRPEYPARSSPPAHIPYSAAGQEGGREKRLRPRLASPARL